MTPADVSPWANPTVLGVIITGGVTLLGAFFAGLVTVINAWRSMARQVSAIEGHVNSEKTASEGRIATLVMKNELLEKMLAEARMTAALLAQAVSNRTANVAPKEGP